MRGVTATIDVATFRADWLTHMPISALCERWTIRKDQVIRLKVVWELPPRHDRRLRAKPERQPDPTPRQIRRACIRIQSTWDENTREERRVVKTQAVHRRRIELTDEAREALGGGDDE